jgi:hypothetical protein
MRGKLRKPRRQAGAFRAARRFPFARRTGNMIDRLMQRTDKRPPGVQHFRGSLRGANLSVRARALIHNFAPFNPYTRKQKGRHGPAEAPNEFRHHGRRLENPLISTSSAGMYRPPQKAV